MSFNPGEKRWLRFGLTHSHQTPLRKGSAHHISYIGTCLWNSLASLMEISHLLTISDFFFSFKRKPRWFHVFSCVFTTADLLWWVFESSDSVPVRNVCVRERRHWWRNSLFSVIWTLCSQFYSSCHLISCLNARPSSCFSQGVCATTGNLVFIYHRKHRDCAPMRVAGFCFNISVCVYVSTFKNQNQGAPLFRWVTWWPHLCDCPLMAGKLYAKGGANCGLFFIGV